jgi:hypothetical protein
MKERRPHFTVRQHPVCDNGTVSIPMLVQVPLDDASALEGLIGGMEGATPAGTAHPFDGETVAQVLVLLSTAGFPYFRTWARSRISARKGFKAVINGVEFSGYTAEEVTSILEHVQREIASNDPDPGA